MSRADVYQAQGYFDSKNEYFLAKAFDLVRLPYRPQVRLFAPASVRGTVKIDFEVYNPFALPVELYGEFWHTGQLGADDRLRELRIFRRYRRAVYRVWGNESDTLEKCTVIARRLKAGDTTS